MAPEPRLVDLRPNCYYGRCRGLMKMSARWFGWQCSCCGHIEEEPRWIEAYTGGRVKSTTFGSILMFLAVSAQAHGGGAQEVIHIAELWPGIALLAGLGWSFIRAVFSGE